jgi:ribosome biogenesis protein Nip4
MQKEKFIPSFPLLDHIAKHTEQIITVDEKTAYLFTCGRDIFGNQVEHKPKGDMMIVTNQHKEVMGVARNDKIKGMYKNILDRGIFLRQEMNKKRK